MVILIVAVVVAVKLTGGPSSTRASSPSATGATASDVTHALATVPMSTLDKIGVGSSAEDSTYQIAPPVPIVGQPALTSGGKPVVFYFGAEWCPYCAAERWAMTVALSKFGSFSGLHNAYSRTNDVYPGTKTVSFAKAKYTSHYLVFQEVEVQNEAGASLQSPTASQLKVLNKYDQPPFNASATAGQLPFPFLDIGGRYLVIQAGYNPGVLKGLSRGTIAGSLSISSAPTAKAIDISANYLIGAICKLTAGAPSSVCASSAAKAAQASLATVKPEG